MKLASYNVENLFQRARALNQETWKEGREVLQMQAELNRILGQQTYSPADKEKILALMKKLGIAKSDDGPFVILRQNRGHLVKRPRTAPVELVADGRADWIGWVDLKLEEVNEVATRNTAQVIRDVDADVIGVVEAENRPSLLRFCENVLTAAGAAAYQHVMLVDGNDDRGIDVAVMTRKGFAIESICSHVDDADANGNRIFSRDCAQYEISTPDGNTLILLINHLKSKGFGSQATSNARRERQARRVKEIYDALKAKHRFIAVVGDLNDTPASGPLAALTQQSDLKDISEHPNFDDGGRPGTFGNGTAANKIDYILLSPDLFARTQKGGIFREGVWGGKNGTLFPHYPEITKASEAASDHAAVWAAIDL